MIARARTGLRNFFGGWKQIFWGGLPFPPPSTPWRPAAAVAASGKVFEKKKIFDKKIFWGGVPPPLLPPRAPPGGLRPQWQLLGKFLRKKNFWPKIFLGGSLSLLPLGAPLPSSTWGPFEALGPLRGPFGAFGPSGLGFGLGLAVHWMTWDRQTKRFI